jgi:hypothetical protein
MLNDPITGELTEQLRLQPSRERSDHVILCSTFEFSFEIQNRIFLEFFVRV